METEKQVEEYLKEEIERRGGICYKFVSPGRKGVPDRLCVLPREVVLFLECKKTGGKATPQQYREILRLRRMGHVAGVVNSRSGIDAILKRLEEIKGSY